MATSAVNNSQAEQIYQSLNTTREKDVSVMNEAENRFLTLLTTQLKNQDPLNPLDNAQLTSQLAQISTVNGIEKLNATLQKLLSGMEDSQAMEAAASTQSYQGTPTRPFWRKARRSRKTAIRSASCNATCPPRGRSFASSCNTAMAH